MLEIWRVCVALAGRVPTCVAPGSFIRMCRDWAGCAAQADAVLGMALRRLTSLEAGKLKAEAEVLAARIAELKVCDSASHRLTTQGR